MTYRKIIIPAQIGAALFGFGLALLVVPPGGIPDGARIIGLVAVTLFGIGGVLTALAVARGLLGADGGEADAEGDDKSLDHIASVPPAARRAAYRHARLRRDG